jgi:hypothetical protein
VQTSCVQSDSVWGEREKGMRERERVRVKREGTENKERERTKENE